MVVIKADQLLVDFIVFKFTADSAPLAADTHASCSHCPFLEIGKQGLGIRKVESMWLVLQATRVKAFIIQCP